ncbi:unnamed protein product [Taenia asiatica]|uniref:MFS domain-containing protein n=1 Tax=Taenia asiatica TaxID=60517 RepID=A0A0R3VX48_TAEAS|nr:unnamed protein product [Taenia asiatica]
MLVDFSAGILLTPLTLKVGFAAVIFTYAIMVGWGVGASYGLLLALAGSWFPKRRGLVVGICACGFGAGAIILTPVQTAIINPQNLAVNNVTQMFDDETMLQRVPKCLYIVGGIMAGLQLIGCVFVRPRPEEGLVLPLGSDLLDNKGLGLRRPRRDINLPSATSVEREYHKILFFHRLATVGPVPYLPWSCVLAHAL